MRRRQAVACTACPRRSRVQSVGRQREPFTFYLLPLAALCLIASCASCHATTRSGAANLLPFTFYLVPATRHVRRRRRWRTRRAAGHQDTSSSEGDPDHHPGRGAAPDRGRWSASSSSLAPPPQRTAAARALARGIAAGGSRGPCSERGFVSRRIERMRSTSERPEAALPANTQQTSLRAPGRVPALKLRPAEARGALSSKQIARLPGVPTPSVARQCRRARRQAPMAPGSMRTTTAEWSLASLSRGLWS